MCGLGPTPGAQAIFQGSANQITKVPGLRPNMKNEKLMKPVFLFVLFFPSRNTPGRIFPGRLPARPGTRAAVICRFHLTRPDHIQGALNTRRRAKCSNAYHGSLEKLREICQDEL